MGRANQVLIDGCLCVIPASIWGQAENHSSQTYSGVKVQTSDPYGKGIEVVTGGKLKLSRQNALLLVATCSIILMGAGNKLGERHEVTTWGTR